MGTASSQFSVKRKQKEAFFNEALIFFPLNNRKQLLYLIAVQCRLIGSLGARQGTLGRRAATRSWRTQIWDGWDQMQSRVNSKMSTARASAFPGDGMDCLPADLLLTQFR